MLKRLQFLRGNTSATGSFTGLVGELTVNTSDWSIHVHDGSTAGGTKLATQDYVAGVATGNISLAGYATESYVTTAIASAGHLTSISGTVTGNLIPNANVSYDLGSASYRFRDLYLSGTTIDLGGQTISNDGNNVVISNLATDSLSITGNLDIGGGIAGYATEDYVASALVDKADLSYVNDINTSLNAGLDLKLNVVDLPTIPTDISDLTDTGNLLTHTSLDGYLTQSDLIATATDGNTSAYAGLTYSYSGVSIGSVQDPEGNLNTIRSTVTASGNQVSLGVSEEHNDDPARTSVGELTLSTGSFRVGISDGTPDNGKEIVFDQYNLELPVPITIPAGNDFSITTATEGGNVSEFTFGLDGTLTLPGGIDVSGQLYLDSNIGFPDGTFQTTALKSETVAQTGYRLQFDTDIYANETGGATDANETGVQFASYTVVRELFDLTPPATSTTARAYVDPEATEGQPDPNILEVTIVSGAPLAINMDVYAIVNDTPEYLGRIDSQVDATTFRLMGAPLTEEVPIGTEFEFYGPGNFIEYAPINPITISWDSGEETVVTAGSTNSPYSVNVFLVTAEDQTALTYPIEVVTDNYTPAEFSHIIDDDNGFKITTRANDFVINANEGPLVFRNTTGDAIYDEGGSFTIPSFFNGEGLTLSDTGVIATASYGDDPTLHLTIDGSPGNGVSITTTPLEGERQIWKFNADGMFTGPVEGMVAVSGVVNINGNFNLATIYTAPSWPTIANITKQAEATVLFDDVINEDVPESGVIEFSGIETWTTLNGVRYYYGIISPSEIALFTDAEFTTALDTSGLSDTFIPQIENTLTWQQNSSNNGASNSWVDPTIYPEIVTVPIGAEVTGSNLTGTETVINILDYYGDGSIYFIQFSGDSGAGRHSTGVDYNAVWYTEGSPSGTILSVVDGSDVIINASTGQGTTAQPGIVSILAPITLANGAILRDSSTDSIAFGGGAGATSQGASAVALGEGAGNDTQGNQAIAVGRGSGNYQQGVGAVGIGFCAGATEQGDYSVAIGFKAARGNMDADGTPNQPANSIMINASSTPLNGDQSGLYINPVREDVANVAKAVYYNTTTKELTYADLGSVSELNDETNGNKLLISADGDLILTNIDGNLSTPSFGGINRGIEWDYAKGNPEFGHASGEGSNSFIKETTGALVIHPHGPGVASDGANLEIITGSVADINADPDYKWTFGKTGSLTFPDGTVQHTAYTAQTNNLYIAATSSGEVISSSDGATWTDPFDSGLTSIGYLAIGGSKIIYTGADTGDPGDMPWIEGLYSTSAWDVQPQLVPGTDGSERGLYYWTEIKYNNAYGTYPWVAVGWCDGQYLDPVRKFPIVGYSANGTNWVVVEPNLESLYDYLGTVIDTYWNDFDFNGEGYFFVGGIDNNNGGIGTYSTDITTPFANLYFDLNEEWRTVEWLGTAIGGDWPYSWSGFSRNDSWYLDFTGTANPAEVNWVDNGGWIQDDLWLDAVGYVPVWSETTSGVVTNPVGGDGNPITGSFSCFIATTNNGQVMFWPNIPAGPWVSIPKPYTVTIDSFAQSATSYIDTKGSSYSQPGEKITITGSAVDGYNGTYYIDGSYFVYTDQALTIPFDTSELDPFTGTATLTWSHGQFLDAAMYADGSFFVGNDDGELFQSTDGGYSWEEVLSAGWNSDYVNDLDYGTTVTAVIESNQLVNGSYTLTLGSDGVLTTPNMSILANTLVAGTSFESGTGFLNLDNGSHLTIGTNNDMPMVISLNEGGGSPTEWTFGTNGTLTLPGEGIVRSNNDTIVLQSYDTTFNVGKGIRIGTNGHVYFELGDDPAYFQIGEASGNASLIAGANLNIVAAGGSSPKNWTFGTDGSITFPDSTVQTTAWTGTVDYTNVSGAYGNANVNTLLSSWGSNSLSTSGSVTGGVLASTNSSGDEGGEITLAAAATNTTLTGGITIDVYQNKLRFFETGGTNRGAYIDLTATGASAGSNLLVGGGGGISNVVEDTTPQLGGNLDLNNSSITGTGTIDITGTAETSGDITVGAKLNVTGSGGYGIIIQNNQSVSWYDSTGTYLTQLEATDATATRTIALPDATGTVALTSDVTTANVNMKGYVDDAVSTIPASYTDANVNTLLSSWGSNSLSTTGNITAANFIGNITLTGNVTGTSSNVEIVAGAFTSTFDNQGDVTLPNLTVSGDIVSSGTVNGQYLALSQSAVISGNLGIGGWATVEGYTVGYKEVPQVSFSGNVTLGLTNSGKHFYATLGGGTYSITIPDNANVAFPVGTAISVVMGGAGNLQILTQASTSLYMAGNATVGSRTVSDYGMATLIKVETNKWFINGTGLA